MTRGGKRPGAGRKPKDGPPLIKRTFALEAEYWDRLEHYAKANQRSLAQTLRLIIGENTG